MTITTELDDTQLLTEHFDIGWSGDTALLCMKHGHLFGEESRSAGAPPLLDLDDLLAEHEDLTAVILATADEAITANYQAWENTHQHTGVIVGEARESIVQARREAIAGRVMIEAIASLHSPPAAETVTSVLPALEPLPLEAATVSEDPGDVDDPELPAEPDGDPDDTADAA